MAQIPHADEGLVCPLHKQDMSLVCHKCPLWILLRGKHPQSEEEIDRWGDLWKYGVRANQSAIDTFIRYSHKEGIISAKPSYGQLFAAGTLDT